MPEKSQEFIMQFSEELKSFNKILADMRKNHVNMNEENLTKLIEAKEKIRLSTDEYIKELKVDGKIKRIIDNLINNRDIHTKSEHFDVFMRSIGGDTTERDVEQQKDFEPKKYYEGIANAIGEDLSEKSVLRYKFNAISERIGDPADEFQFNPRETITAIREIFAIINKNRRIARLGNSEDENIADLQNLEILWHGASTIADESNIQYFRMNLAIAIVTILGPLIGGPVIAVAMITLAAISAATGVVSKFSSAVGNLEKLNSTASLSDIAGILDVANAFLIKTLAAIPMSFYFAGVVSAQYSKNMKESVLLGQALKKVVAVFEAVDDAKKKIEPNRQTPLQM